LSVKPNELVQVVAELKEDKVPVIVQRRLEAGDDPLNILHDCQEGMRLVGDQYGQGRYYISGLIMAGEILRQVMELIGPAIKNSRQESKSSGVILLGTVQADIHDLGKNIVNMLFTCHGFTVHDLGVDVPPARFVSETVRLKPDIVGLSGLLTASYDSMRETMVLLREATRDWPKPPYVVIGGGQIDQQVSQLVGTDYWVNEASEGLRLCQRLLSG
jgi:methanogenic corrinoid protein MtbC1